MLHLGNSSNALLSAVPMYCELSLFHEHNLAACDIVAELSIFAQIPRLCKYTLSIRVTRAIAVLVEICAEMCSISSTVPTFPSLPGEHRISPGEGYHMSYSLLDFNTYNE
jgi:hypothetical protein